MTVMGGPEMGSDSEDSARITRRNVLKGGVAVGVGITAWATPNIRSIGGTPAYAQVCTVDNVGFFLGCQNTRASCDNGVGFKPIFGAGGTTFGTGGALLENFTGAGGKTTPGSGCPPFSSVTITVPTDQAGCRLTVIVHQGNCGAWTWNSALQVINECPAPSCELGRASTPFVVGAGNSAAVLMPTIPCSGSGGGTIPCNVFWSAVVECNTSLNCV